MSYYEKYMKYKKKYIHEKNKQKGGSIDDYVSKEVKMGFDNYRKVINNQKQILNNLRDNNNQKIIIEKHGDNLYKFRNPTNGMCITSNNRDLRSQFIDRECEDGNENQLFNIKNKIGNNTYILNHNSNKDICIDNGVVNANERPLHLLQCNQEKLNQHIKIMPNIVNTDNNGNHIKPFIQNLILSYKPRDMPEDYRYNDNSPHMIAQRASLMHGNLMGTQSAIWCPLIFNALRLSGIHTFNNWSTYNNPDLEKQNIFNELSLELSRIPNWSKYAINILMYRGHINVLRNDFTEAMFRESDRLRDEFL
jgi:hypothetical protein